MHNLNYVKIGASIYRSSFCRLGAETFSFLSTMAPRTTKAKKVANVKGAEMEASKKGSGKANIIEVELADVDMINKVTSERKTKRGNVYNEKNETADIVVPAPKKGKKNENTLETSEKGDSALDKEVSSAIASQEINDNGLKTNGHSEDAPILNGKGKKKQTKKNTTTDKTSELKPGQDKKNTKQLSGESEESAVDNEEKKKPLSKGRSRKAQPKTDEEKEEKTENGEQEVKPEPVKAGRKKPQAKSVKDKIPERESDRLTKKGEVPAEKPVNEPAKQVKSGKKKGQNKTVEEITPEQEGLIKDHEVQGEKQDDKPEKEVKSGRKKGQTKTVREKTPEQEEGLIKDGVQEEKPVDKASKESKTEKKKGQSKVIKEKIPKAAELKENGKEHNISEDLKKEGKGKKTRSKKLTKEESGDKEESQEDKTASKNNKAYKEEKGKGDGKTEDEAADEEMVHAKPAKGKRGFKKLADAAPEPQETQDTGEPNKRKRKVTGDEASAEDSKKKALKNKASTNYEDIDFSNHSQNAQGKDWNFKISGWNVDGIRAWMTKGGLDFIKYEKPDILCLQEVKCAQDKLPEEIANMPGYHAYWLSSEKDGYAGVGIYTSKLAMNVQYGLQNEELDDEGRIITAEYEEFYLISTYVVNAGRNLITLPRRLQWNEDFRKHVKELDKKKPVIICGDMNVAHNEIDLSNPKNNKKNAGFTEEERAGMSDLLGDGFVDTFRHLNPDKSGAYTFWTYMMNCRAKNVGWRLDYFIVSERLLPAICDSVIRSEVYGSDHCPISLFLHLTSAEKPKEELV